MPTIYDLTYDFEQQNGLSVVITHEGERRLHSKDLAKIQVNMMKSNIIDHVLPLEIEEIDFKVKLYYNITSKRMLPHALREGRFTIGDLYNLLYHVVSTVEASKEYTLNEQQYILKEEFIYIGNNYSDVFLTYLPLNQILSKPSMKDELRDLLIMLVGQVQELKGDGVQQLMNYLQDPSFNLTDLKEKLATLRKGPANNHSVQPTPMYQEQQAPPQPEIGAVQQPVEQQPIHHPTNQSKPNVPKKKQAPKKSPPAKAKKKQGQEVEAEEVQEPPKPKKVVIMMLSLLAMAGVWKLFETNPSEGMLYLCIGLSLLVVTVAYYIIFVWPMQVVKKRAKSVESHEQKPPKQPKKKQKQTKKKNVQQDEMNQGIKPNAVDQQPPQLNQQPSQQQVMQYEQSAATNVSDSDYYNNLENQTTLLEQPQASTDTVLLNEGQPTSGTPFLEVEKNGRIENIPLTKASFLIGRNPSGVEYTEDSVGVSRVHAEFTIGPNYHTIKDLGSKNGTKLNKENLVAYKEYDLKDGDVIEIGKVLFTFKIG